MGFFRDPRFGIGIFYCGLDWKIPKIPKSRDFMQNSRVSGFFGVSGFWSPGFFTLGNGIFREILGIRDFFGIFYLRNIPGIFYPRDRDFFRGMVYPDKKPTLVKGSLNWLYSNREIRKLKKETITKIFKRHVTKLSKNVRFFANVWQSGFLSAFGDLY